MDSKLTDEQIRNVISQHKNGLALLKFFPLITADDVVKLYVERVIDKNYRINGRRLKRYLKTAKIAKKAVAYADPYVKYEKNVKYNEEYIPL